MHSDDLTKALADGYATLRSAQSAEPARSGADATGKDSEGYVEVTVDGRGLLTDIVFSDDIDQLRPSELESRVQEALQEAHRATGRPRIGAVPDIGDSEVSARARWILGIEED
ncbi:MAG: YbaB/EbfC family nucleoid-associated protein [Microbacterium sp.]